MMATMTNRVLIGTGTLGLVGVLILLSQGHASLALPWSGGVVWGMLNVVFIGRVVRHIRPDQDVKVGRLIGDIALKGPLMYVAAFLLLFRQPAPVVLAAGAGFTLVLVVMLLRALGALVARASRRSIGPGRIEG